MEASEKTKEQLINELAKLRQQITKLKESEIKRKKIEEDFEKSRQEFTSLFKNNPEALIYTDEKGNILDINPCFRALFGYTLEEIKGRNIDNGMITAPDKMKEAKKLTSETLKKDFYFETVRKKKNGTLFPAAISGSRVIIGGRFKGLIASYRDITERQKMIDDLKNSEEKYRSLYENMPGAYYRTDKDGNLIMINPEGAKLFGYNSSEDILGKNMSQHFYFAPEERKKYLKELEKNKGNLKDYEITLKKKDGSPLVISDTSHYYYDKEGNIAGVEGIFVDITERKEAEMAIIYEQSLLHALMDNIPDFIYFKDEKNRFVRVNKASGEDRGITPEDFIGKTDFDIFTEEAAKKCFADDDRVMKTGKPLINRIEKITYLNGMERWFSATKVPRYDEKGKIIGTIGITRDITQRKKMEEDLQKLAHFDNLTGSCNRGHGLALVDQQLKLAHRKKQKISLVYFDIDGFKDINDTFGHKEGDRVLKEVAKLFKSTLRKVDIICRIGGDEFLLIFPDSSLNDVPLIIERLNKNLEKLNQTLNKPYKIGFSIGISYYDPDHPQSIDELISIADENMYKEKNKKSKQSEDSIKD